MVIVFVQAMASRALIRLRQKYKDLSLLPRIVNDEVKTFNNVKPGHLVRRLRQEVSGQIVSHFSLAAELEN
jgi:hypothetical protein